MGGVSRLRVLYFLFSCTLTSLFLIFLLLFPPSGRASEFGNREAISGNGRPSESSEAGSGGSANQRMDVKAFIKYVLIADCKLHVLESAYIILQLTFTYKSLCADIYIFSYSFSSPLRAAELDDVLLQAMWRRPRGCLRELMSNARTKAAAGGYKKSVADVIEEDLLAVLEPAMNKSSTDAANNKRRGVSLGAAFGKFLSLMAFG